MSAADRSCLDDSRRRAVALALAEPSRARSYVDRARRAGFLPEIRLLYQKQLGRAETLDPSKKVSSTASPVRIDTDDDVRYEARATWDLARLVFSPEELGAQAQALRMADARREIEALVDRIYFERRRLIMETTILSHDDDTDAALKRHLRIEELESELDALTGGHFDACRARAPAPRSPR